MISSYSYYFNSSKKFIIGIDQSYSNTGIVVLNTELKVIEEIHSIKSTVKFPNWESSSFLKEYTQRLLILLKDIFNIIENYPVSDTIIGIEYLASGSSLKSRKSMDTDYVLSHLFFSLFEKFDKNGYLTASIMPSIHKKNIFPAVKKSKDLMYADHWDESFLDTGFSLNKLSFKNNDQKDAFCIAYFLYTCFSNNFRSISSLDKVKTKKDRQKDAIKSFLCVETRNLKKCWECPFYKKCKEKNKYRIPKTKKEKELYNSLQDGILK